MELEAYKMPGILCPVRMPMYLFLKAVSDVLFGEDYSIAMCVVKKKKNEDTSSWHTHLTERAGIYIFLPKFTSFCLS